MKLRTPRAVARATLALVLLLGLTCREKASPRFNLLLITIDTIRADRVGAYGDASARTPVIDRLAREGVRFEQATSAVPLTLPSHATILTGLLPPHHQLRNNGAGKLPQDVPTLATVLSAAGYRTAAFVGAFVLDRRFGLNRGFETYDDQIEAARRENASLEAERPAEVVATRAVEWLHKSDGRPFFAWVHFYDPHAPYGPPEPFRGMFAQDPYAGEIAYTDNQLGRLLDELDRQGIADRTVVVVAGDHGEALGEHGELTHGVLLYEPTLRVPLIIRAPEAFRPSVVQSPVSLADLAPTLAALLVNHKFADSRVGMDLTATLRGAKSPERILYSETEYPTLFGWSGLASARSGSWKYVDSPAPELYDLERDRSESRNLYGAERRAMRSLLQAIETIRRTATPQKPEALDEETARKLASLGYVAPTGEVSSGAKKNPTEVIGLFRTFEEATWAMAGGRVSEATTMLQSLVDADPENPVFRSVLAKAFRQQGRLRPAIALYREAVALRPDDSEAWYNLAAAFQEANDHRNAATAVREAIRRDPSRPEAHNVLGIAYSAEGKLDAALEQFREAARLDPRNARAFNNSGNVYRSMQRYDEAEAAYRRAIQLDPGYADPWNGLGTLQVERGRPREAIQFFDRALALSPSAHEARLNRAVALQLAGDLASAVREYRTFLAAVGDDPAYASQRRTARQMVSRLEQDL